MHVSSHSEVCEATQNSRLSVFLREFLKTRMVSLKRFCRKNWLPGRAPCPGVQSPIPERSHLAQRSSGTILLLILNEV